MDSTTAAATTERFRKAGEAGDVEGLLATLAPDIVLHSPITDSAAFHGIDEMRQLMTAVFETIADIEYSDDVGDDHVRYITSTGRIGRQPIEETMRIRLDDQARINDITIFVRPLPGLTAMLAGLGPKLARSRPRAAAVSATTRPLALITRLTDKPGVRLAGLSSEP
jgi:hypothetical protein